MFGSRKENKTLGPSSEKNTEEKYESPVIAVSDFLRKDDLKGLEIYVHNHKKEVHDSIAPDQVIPEIEVYITHCLHDAEAEDDDTSVDKIYKLEHMHLISLEAFKKNAALREATNHAIKVCKENSNINLSSRLENLLYEAA